MMREINDRVDDISEFEKTMTRMKFEMAEVEKMDKKWLSKIVDESQTRDQKFEELIKRRNEDVRVRDQKTKAKITGIENQIEAKIEDKFPDLEVRLSAVEKTDQNQTKGTAAKENPRTVPV